MKGASKVIMGATLVMVATLAIVLALILVLLAELYCSLLLRRRRSRSQLKRSTTDTTTGPATPTITESTTSPLSSFYAQGVLHPPTDFLFPAATTLPNMAEKENKLTFLHRVIELHGRESNTRPHRSGILSPISPSASFAASPSNAEEISGQACSGSSGSGVEDLVYISNPIYDNDAAPDTPFETPDTSPSRLENGGSSGEEEEEDKGCFGIYSPPPFTPPLSPIKKLPAQAVSVPLRDVGSLATSASDSNCNNGVSSSSSTSPCTSPSW
ncbi:hypothetical protein HRI_003441100 [Hibiscus trionum]|uniref:Uncharacterized protein n=1 Tax=Hibiscus trionum TaxID=183268 RepID=A0A9W7IPE1_HIBTR|nr:hypothetical protein HRI_003441100 [Hibiscus trionum]